MNKKRFTSLLILFSMLLASCGSSGSGTSDTTGASGDASDTSASIETAAPSPLESLPDNDFKGAVYTMLDANDYQSTYQNVPGDEMNGDILNDALFERDAYIENKYNVVVNYEVTGTSDGYTFIRNDVMAGDKHYNLLCGGLASGMATMATEGIFANLYDMSDLSLDERWWSSYINEGLTYDGKLFTTSGDLAPTMYAMLSALYLNNTLLEEYDLMKDYYGMVKEGKWTLDVLQSMTRDLNRDLNNDGNIHVNDDFIGFAYMKNEVTAGAFMCGSGNSLSTTSGNDIKLDLQNQHVSDSVEKVLELITPIIQYENQADIMKPFGENRILALIHLTASGKNYYRDMKDDFMILPVPKFDESQENYRSFANTWTTAFFAVPFTSADDFTGFVTEALARYSYEKVRPKYFELVIKQKGARDEGSCEMLDIIFDTAYLDLNAVYDFGKTKTAFIDILFNEMPLASTLASAMSAADGAIDEFKEAWSKAGE